MEPRKLSHHAYKVGWICPLEVEQIAAMEMLDEEHKSLLQPSGDTNVYNLGSINHHNIVIAGLPKAGNCSTATVLTQMRRTFPRLQYCLLVGIGGGVPVTTDQGMIRLGHVVVSEPRGTHSGAVQYDRGKARADHFENQGVLAPPPTALLNAAREVAVQRQRMDRDPVWENTQRILTNRPRLCRFRFPGCGNDHLYPPDYEHRQIGLLCEEAGCDPKQRIELRRNEEEDDPFIVVHRGLIASGELVIKDAKKRDLLAQEHGVLCFETEAVGALADFPCMVIRGISDYCDSHKNDVWHGYAAAVAAAYARQLFFHLSIEDARSTDTFTLPLNISGISEVTRFVAREDELRRIQEVLEGSHGRRMVVLHGLGGIGKTQLAITYIKRHTMAPPYSAVLWFNARDEPALKQSFSRAAEWILRHQPSITYIMDALESRDLDQMVQAVKYWLEEPMNHNWLAVFDNYDNPSAFDLRTYIAETNHGAIIVTTRSSMVKLGHTIQIDKLENIRDGLQILMSVSGRENLGQDPAAIDLAERLDGLPLALATAGSYLEQVSVTCAEYLELYDSSWQQLHQDTPQLPTYDQKLFSTWNISYTHIKEQDPNAAMLLRLWGYFDNEDLWYELLNDCGTHKTEWLGEILKSKLTFHRTLRVLCSHGLVEADQSAGLQQVESRGYSVNGCVHSWVKHVLNEEYDSEMACIAIKCVAAHVPETDTPYYWLMQRRLLPHANRWLATIRGMEDVFEMTDALHALGILYTDQGRLGDAEMIYNRALWGFEKFSGLEDASIFNIIHDLGYLYERQGQFDKAEVMYNRALQGKEKVLGPEHPLTLHTVNNLGFLYTNQGRLTEAERIYTRTLEGFESAWGKEHMSTLLAMNNLGNLYARQGRLENAETIYRRALQGLEKTLGPEHPEALNTVNNLGNLYATQSRLHDAGLMYNRALEGYEKIWGPESTSTLYTLNNLGNLLTQQCQLGKAEIVYSQALQGFEKAWGAEHLSTLDIVNNLGNLYTEQGRLDQAVAMYNRALQGYQKALDSSLFAIYMPALNTLEGMGDVFVKLGKIEEALKYYYQARDGAEAVFERSSPSYVELRSKITSAESRYNELIASTSSVKISSTAKASFSSKASTDYSRKEHSIRTKMASLWNKARKGDQGNQ